MIMLWFLLGSVPTNMFPYIWKIWFVGRGISVTMQCFMLWHISLLKNKETHKKKQFGYWTWPYCILDHIKISIPVQPPIVTQMDSARWVHLVCRLCLDFGETWRPVPSVHLYLVLGRGSVSYEYKNPLQGSTCFFHLLSRATGSDIYCLGSIFTCPCKTYFIY